MENTGMWESQSIADRIAIGELWKNKRERSENDESMDAWVI